MPGFSADKKKSFKKEAALVVEKCGPFPFSADRCAGLPFMQLINIFSGIFATPQPRSNIAERKKHTENLRYE